MKNTKVYVVIIEGTDFVGTYTTLENAAKCIYNYSWNDCGEYGYTEKDILDNLKDRCNSMAIYKFCLGEGTVLEDVEVFETNLNAYPF